MSFTVRSDVLVMTPPMGGISTTSLTMLISHTTIITHLTTQNRLTLAL